MLRVAQTAAVSKEDCLEEREEPPVGPLAGP